MSKISCEMCRDLMPLVRDGIASEDSCAAVRDHIQDCPECKELFAGELPPPSDGKKMMEQMKRKLQLCLAMLLMFGILLGLSLTAREEMFYNTLIMPFIGIVGYAIFRLKSVVVIPVLLFISQFIMNWFGGLFGGEHLDGASLIMWVGIYCIFVGIGIVIAALFHFAFRKEK